MMRIAKIAFGVCLIGLASCSGPQGTHVMPTGDSDDRTRIGMANPASVYCRKIGGTLVIQNTEKGQVGFCHLPDGTVIEEWALFRRDHSAGMGYPENRQP